MTINEHVAAIVALLDADDVPPALVIHVGKVPSDATPPYVCVYFSHISPEQAESQALDGRSTRVVVRAICHSVGGNETAAFAVAQRVSNALLDVVPTVAGRACFPIRHEIGEDPRRDEGTGQQIQDKLDVYRLETVPG